MLNYFVGLGIIDGNIKMLTEQGYEPSHTSSIEDATRRRSGGFLVHVFQILIILNKFTQHCSGGSVITWKRSQYSQISEGYFVNDTIWKKKINNYRKNKTEPVEVDPFEVKPYEPETQHQSKLEALTMGAN